MENNQIYIDLNLETPMQLYYNNAPINATVNKIRVKKIDIQEVLGKKDLDESKKISKEAKNQFEIITKQLSELQTNLSKTEEDWENKNAEFSNYLKDWKDKIDKKLEEKLEEKDNAIAELEGKLETKTKDFDDVVELKNKQIIDLETKINKLTAETNTNFENLNQEYKSNFLKIESETREKYGILKDDVQSQRFEKRSKDLTWRVGIAFVLFIVTGGISFYFIYNKADLQTLIPVSFLSFTLYNWYNQKNDFGKICIQSYNFWNFEANCKYTQR